MRVFPPCFWFERYFLKKNTLFLLMPLPNIAQPWSSTTSPVQPNLAQLWSPPSENKKASKAGRGHDKLGSLSRANG